MNRAARSLFVVLAALLLTPTVACGGRSPPTEVDNSAEGEGEGEGEGEDNGGSVAWSEELPNPYLFPGPDDADGVLDPNAYDFFLQFTVELPDPNTPPAHLTAEVCMQRASEATPTCGLAIDEIAQAGGGGYRWGFDPSQYDSGLNVYEHILTLTQGDSDVDSETLRYEVTAP